MYSILASRLADFSNMKMYYVLTKPVFLWFLAMSLNCYYVSSSAFGYLGKTGILSQEWQDNVPGMSFPSPFSDTMYDTS